GPLFGDPGVELPPEIVDPAIRRPVARAVVRVLIIWKGMAVGAPNLARLLPRAERPTPRAHPPVTGGAGGESIGIAGPRLRQEGQPIIPVLPKPRFGAVHNVVPVRPGPVQRFDPLAGAPHFIRCDIDTGML